VYKQSTRFRDAHTHDLVNLEMTLKTYRGPTLQVSYDGPLGGPAGALQELAAFCGVPFREEVAGLVKPERKHF
jgi:hypothetical protein